MKFESREQFFSHFLKDAAAVHMNLMLAFVVHIWDDLIDRDKPVTRAELNRAFRFALVELPANLFYRRHFDELKPLIDNMILSWHTANALEAQDESEGLRIAYIIRSDYMTVFLKSIQLAHGFDYATQQAPAIRRYWHQEGWGGYLANLTQERANQMRPENVL